MKYRNPVSWFIADFFLSLIYVQALVAIPFGYVTNTVDNTISVIDTATNTIVTAISIGFWPTDIAVMPDGSKAYVCNGDDHTVSVINTITNAVVKNPIPVGKKPIGIAITSDGSKAYVCNADDNTVSVIDTATDTIKGQAIPVGRYPRDIAITPDGIRVYVCNANDNTVSVIDTATNIVQSISIPVCSRPIGITITPDGSKAYVCSSYEHIVSVIKLANNSVINTILVSLPPNCVAITPDGAKAYVATSYSDFDSTSHSTNSCTNFPNLQDGEVFVIDTATDKVIDLPIHIGHIPFGIAITPDGSQAYVCDSHDDTVSIIDTASDTIVAHDIPIGHYPLYIAFGPVPTAPSSPRKFIGTIKRHNGSFWRKTSLSMKWKQSSSTNVDHYEIFGSGKLIASIPASAPLRFHKRLHPYVHDKRLSTKYLHFLHEKYRIRAVSIFGTVSPFKKLKIATQILRRNNSKKMCLSTEARGTDLT